VTNGERGRVRKTKRKGMEKEKKKDKQIEKERYDGRNREKERKTTYQIL
jgi:hypothetical protein